MKIGVVIPTLDEAEVIEAAIASAAVGPPELPEIGETPVEGQGAAEVEIVVVDGGSQDDTRERARNAGARVIDSPPGRAVQLQAGLQASSGDVVLFLHADTQLPPSWPEAVSRALADEESVGGAFRFRFDVRSPALRFIEWGVHLRVALFGLPYGDQAVFARRDVLQRIGGVPQQPIGEDVDLVRALARQGRLVALPDPVTTSARRYRSRGAFRTMFRNWAALAAFALGLDRRRVADWYRRGSA